MILVLVCLLCRRHRAWEIMMIEAIARLSQRVRCYILHEMRICWHCICVIVVFGCGGAGMRSTRRFCVLLLIRIWCAMIWWLLLRLSLRLCRLIVRRRWWIIFAWPAPRQMTPFHKLIVIHHPKWTEVILVSHKAFMQRQIRTYRILRVINCNLIWFMCLQNIKMFIICVAISDLISSVCLIA